MKRSHQGCWVSERRKAVARHNTTVAVGVGLAAALTIAGSAAPVAAAQANGRSHAGAGAARRVATGMITGVVLGAAGRPLAGVCVSATRQVIASESAAGVAGVPTAATARTSARGEYFIAGLSPGGYSLSFR